MIEAIKTIGEKMMAGWATKDYALISGDDWRQEIVLVDAHEAPINLTGFTITLALDWPGGHLELGEGEGITIHAAQGTIVLALTPEETRALPRGRLTRYQLRLTTPFDPPLSLAEGLRTYLRGFLVVKPALFEADQ